MTVYVLSSIDESLEGNLGVYANYEAAEVARQEYMEEYMTTEDTLIIEAFELED